MKKKNRQDFPKSASTNTNKVAVLEHLLLKTPSLVANVKNYYFKSTTLKGHFKK